MSRKGYEIGSRNVFQDIGVPNAEEHLVKAQLVFKIDAIRKERRLKQIEVADLLGIRQPDVSKMLRGEFRQFSVAPSAFSGGAQSGRGNRREAPSWQEQRSRATCRLKGSVVFVGANAVIKTLLGRALSEGRENKPRPKKVS
jgi:predicted XRE-type DNA-binding protein